MTESDLPSAILIKGITDGSNTVLPPITNGMIAQTPDSHPNVRFTVIGPARALTIRFIHTFLVSLFGSPIAISVTTPFSGFRHLIVTAIVSALSIAVVDLGKNLITIFSKLEAKYPVATGNV